MALLWTYAEQQTIKEISENNETLFDKIAEETQIKDLQELIGFDFYQDLVQDPDSTANAKLLDGGTWEIGGVTYTFDGLKYALAYFFFARYISDSRNFDTFSAFVYKNLEDSTRLTEGAIKNLALQNRQIAFKYWEQCEQFIIDNVTDYPYYYGTTPVRGRNNGWDPDKIFCI